MRSEGYGTWSVCTYSGFQFRWNFPYPVPVLPGGGILMVMYWPSRKTEHGKFQRNWNPLYVYAYFRATVNEADGERYQRI